MDLLLQLQQDLTDKLNSEAYFATISVAKLRDLVISQEIEKRLPHLTAKGGKFGCGVLVNMPEVLNSYANVDPPVSDFLLTLDVVENPELNFNAATGTLLTCEEVARQVRAVLTIFCIGLAGEASIYAPDESPVIAPIPDISRAFPGCAGYRVNLKFKAEESFQTKTAMPTLSNSVDTITLSNNTAGATIYYTIDGTFPGAGSASGTAEVYFGPFVATSGATIRFAAYAAGSLGSDVGTFTAP